MRLINFIKNNQEKLVLITAYLLVAILCFGLGRMTSTSVSSSEIKVEEVFTAPLNDTQKIDETQSPVPKSENIEGNDNCTGKIKGNISSKGEKIYHVPGGSFYNRTQAETCFNTEDEAKAAGFRKSSK